MTTEDELEDAAIEAIHRGFNEVMAIIQDLADHQGPVGWDAHGRPPLCLLCASPGPGLASLDAHQPFCPWRRAREWVDANNVTVTETGMTHDTRH